MTTTCAGAQAKQLGLDLVELHDTAWLEQMRDEAKRISQRVGMVSSDDLRLYCDIHGLQPNSPNSYGAIFRGKGWREIGRKKSIVVSNNYREIRVWRWEGLSG